MKRIDLSRLHWDEDEEKEMLVKEKAGKRDSREKGEKERVFLR